MRVQQFERVQLTRPVARDGLTQGAVGTLMDTYSGGRAYEVEFPELEETDITATLTADEVVPFSALAAGKP